MSDSLQHNRIPCPSPTPRGCSNSCPSSQWCHPTISSSIVPFFSCLQSFPELGSFLMSQFFASGGQSIGASASASVLPMNIQDWFPLGLTAVSLQSKGLSRVFSNTIVKKHKHYFTNKGPSSQIYGFSTSHVWMWELDHKGSWVPKNWCFWTVVLEKILESPLDSKEIQPVNPKGNQPWIFTERLMLKLKVQYFGHLMWRAHLLKKTVMLGKIEKKEKGMAKDKMVR